MTPEEIHGAASEAYGWLQDTMAEMAMSIMDWPEIQDDWGPRIKKAKAAGVTDIHGWLADEMYNDVDTIQDMLGDHIHDLGNTEEDRIAIANELAAGSHTALVKACSNLIAGWIEQKERKKEHEAKARSASV